MRGEGQARTNLPPILTAVQLRAREGMRRGARGRVGDKVCARARGGRRWFGLQRWRGRALCTRMVGLRHWSPARRHVSPRTASNLFRALASTTSSFSSARHHIYLYAHRIDSLCNPFDSSTAIHDVAFLLARRPSLVEGYHCKLNYLRGRAASLHPPLRCYNLQTLLLSFQ